MELWSWLLTGLGALTMYLAGSKRPEAWLVGLALWLVYAWQTRQWGFVASVLLYGSIYLRNWLKWRHHDHPSR